MTSNIFRVVRSSEAPGRHHLVAVILRVVLGQAHSGPADPVTQLAGVLYVQVDLHMTSQALLIPSHFSTVGTHVRSVCIPLDHRFQ